MSTHQVIEEKAEGGGNPESVWGKETGEKWPNMQEKIKGKGHHK